uniref:3-oxo-5alpha-steroid 4-dehydrogenase (NADP(+)) n=1 Tax=Acrobeloides nanus TaxID=290746 RepID=A0A914DJ70_9BILA
MILSGLITAAYMLVFKQRATYGRYGKDAILNWLAVPARLAWFIQEAPSLLIPLLVLLFDPVVKTNYVNLSIILMFAGHYFHRTMIYPFLIKGGKPTPFHLMFLGIVFCIWNGYIQGFYHTLYADYPSGYMTRFTSILGILLFFIGMFINCHSDHILRNLRKPGETGYKIPKGGMFEYVSGANFLGEIIEWFGYALYAQTWPAVAFAVFTISNIGPRALHHHQWYLQKFDDYPKTRRALIPFLL